MSENRFPAIPCRLPHLLGLPFYAPNSPSSRDDGGLTDANSVVGDTSPIPPEAPTAEEDEDLLGKYPWIDAPICKMDYGYNIKCCNPPFLS